MVASVSSIFRRLQICVARWCREIRQASDKMDHGHPAASDGSTATSVAMYMLASSLMLLINKMLIADLPCPFFILACQFGSSAVLAHVHWELNLPDLCIYNFWCVGGMEIHDLPR